jgi:hypothetical protein
MGAQATIKAATLLDIEISLWQPSTMWNKFTHGSWSPIKKNYILIRYDENRYVYVRYGSLEFLKVTKPKKEEFTYQSYIKADEKTFQSVRTFLDKCMVSNIKLDPKEFLSAVVFVIKRGSRGKYSGDSSTGRKSSRNNDEDVYQPRNRHGESWCRACNEDGTIRGYPV